MHADLNIARACVFVYLTLKEREERRREREEDGDVDDLGFRDKTLPETQTTISDGIFRCVYLLSAVP
jgi:hypothetical protein